MTHTHEGAQDAARRSQGYWLLSGLFLEVPTPDGLRALIDALDTSSGPAAHLRAGAEQALANPDAAAIAFTRYLCIGDSEQSEPLPFESHVREGRLPGENTAHVCAFIAQAGYQDIAPQAPSPDHLGSELRFMSLLCHAEHAAWDAGDTAAAQESLRLQWEFLNEHLGQWVPAYCNGLAERTNNGYVEAIASATASTITGEIALVDDLCRRAALQQGTLAPAA